MEKSEILEYIRANEITSYRLAKITGLSQATLYRNLSEPEKMKKATFEKLKKAIIEIQKAPHVYLNDNTNDEKLATIIQQEEYGDSSSKDKILKDQAEALKLSSEHIGKLLEQIARQMERIERLEERLRELEGK